MTRSSPTQVAFTSGEISPLLYGRPDFQRFQTGLRSCNGFLPLRQGGVTRAPGTIFRGYTDGNNAGRLITFEFAVNDAMQLEFTPNKLRFWRYGVLVDNPGNPGTPYEIATPYGSGAIKRLRWVQSADVIYIQDGVLPRQRLARLALDSWTIGDQAIDDGPFLVQNLDKTSTIQSSGEIGSVTLTASKPIFGIPMINGLIQLKPESYENIPLWAQNETISVGTKRRYGGNTYNLSAGTTTGVSPPTHLEGIEETTSGTKWEFRSDGVGIARITGYNNQQSVTADVIKRIPKPCKDAPTYRWAEGAWSDKNGYPLAIEIEDQRLWGAKTPTSPRTLWASGLGVFNEYEPGTQDIDSFGYSVSGSESLNSIEWIAAAWDGIVVGALGEVFSVRSADRSRVVSATTFTLKKDVSIGVSPARPITPDGNPIFIAKDEKRLFELQPSLEKEGNRAVEISLPSDHLGTPGFLEIVWQSAAQRVAWIRRGDGTLAAMLFDPKEDVLGWAPYSLSGGYVESICASPDPTNGQDTITMIVRRTINGATVRMIEEQPLPYGVLDGSQPISEAVHFFAASVFDPGGTTDTFAVPHLIGETVYVWTDQGEFGPLVVPAGGTLVLSGPVGYAVIGLFDTAHEAETLDIRAAAQDGDTTGRDKRLLPGGGLRVHRTAAGTVSIVQRELNEPDLVGDAVPILQLPVAASLTQGFSGVTELQVPGSWAKETSYRFLPQGGAPLTILGVTSMIDEAEN